MYGEMNQFKVEKGLHINIANLYSDTERNIPNSRPQFNNIQLFKYNRNSNTDLIGTLINFKIC